MEVVLTAREVRDAIANFVHHVKEVDIRTFTEIDIYIDDEGARVVLLKDSPDTE